MPAKPIPKDQLVQVASSSVKYKDIFDMKTFYEALHEWLAEYQWTDIQDKSDKYETFYGERIGRDGAKELWIRWRMHRNPEGAPMLTYYLDFDYHCLQLISTEVVREGKKLKVNKGEVEIIVKAFIEEKYKEKFAGHSLLRHVGGLFSRRIYDVIMNQRKKELYQEVYILLNFIKQWFKLKRYHPYEEVKPFQTSYAWPSHLEK
ncbi:MAG: hypothetical protein AB1668_00020 [Nanoarchaeota archaeon]